MQGKDDKGRKAVDNHVRSIASSGQCEEHSDGTCFCFRGGGKQSARRHGGCIGFGAKDSTTHRFLEEQVTVVNNVGVDGGDNLRSELLSDEAELVSLSSSHGIQEQPHTSNVHLGSLVETTSMKSASDSMNEPFFVSPSLLNDSQSGVDTVSVFEVSPPKLTGVGLATRQDINIATGSCSPCVESNDDMLTGTVCQLKQHCRDVPLVPMGHSSTEHGTDEFNGNYHTHSVLQHNVCVHGIDQIQNNCVTGSLHPFDDSDFEIDLEAEISASTQNMSQGMDNEIEMQSSYRPCMTIDSHYNMSSSSHDHDFSHVPGDVGSGSVSMAQKRKHDYDAHESNVDLLHRLNAKIVSSVECATKKQRKAAKPTLPLMYSADMRKRIKNNPTFKGSDVAKRYLNARSNNHSRPISKFVEPQVSRLSGGKKKKR